MAAKKRLIDANALLKVLKHRVKGNEDSGIVLGTNSTLDIMEEWVRSIPTVEAVEVVHGSWECTYDAELGETDVTCSHCKDTRTINGCYVTSNGESCYFEDNYCPNYGAKMDLKGE